MTVVASASVGLFYLAMFVMSFSNRLASSGIRLSDNDLFCLASRAGVWPYGCKQLFLCQAVGSAIAALVLLIALYKWRS